jgi:hypothetical protein
MKHLEIFESFTRGKKLLVILYSEETDGKDNLKNVIVSVGKSWYQCMDMIIREYVDTHDADAPRDLGSLDDTNDIEDFVRNSFRKKGLSDHLLSVKCIEIEGVSGEDSVTSFFIDENSEFETEEDLRYYLKKNFSDHYSKIMSELQSDIKPSF